MSTHNLPANPPEPLLFTLQFSPSEIRTMYHALETVRARAIGGDADLHEGFLVMQAISAEIKMQLHLDHAGFRRWLAELPPSIPTAKEAR